MVFPINNNYSTTNKQYYAEAFNGFSLQNPTAGKYYSIFGTRESNRTNFGDKTLSLMYKVPHKTNLLNIAQNYIGKIVEVTDEELSHMTPFQRQGTQAEIIGNKGLPSFAWCAYTVTYMCNEAGIDIGAPKASVQEYINWGTEMGFYKPIKTNTISSVNYIQERANRTKQIKAQTKNMHEGDLIVWKSDVTFATQLGFKTGKASHIGFIEKVNPDGSVVVIEGNANENRQDSKYERYVVTNETEGKIGNQEIGEYQEINPRDGIIRKVYTPEELAANGYSGYINMQKIIK